MVEKSDQDVKNASTKSTRAAKSKSLGVIDPKRGSITVLLRRGTIACSPDQRATVRALGLKKRGSQRTLENTPSVRGMIKKVLHLLDIVSEVRPQV